jgi:signal transduction histidine kinase
VICFIDYGIRILEDNHKHLFRLNSNFKRPGTADEPGTGLGLIESQEFIQIGGGSITVESEMGKGSRFCIALPVN